MRHAAALAAIAVLAYLLGVVFPRRTEVRLDLLRQRIAADPSARLRFYHRYLIVGALAVAVSALVVLIGGEGFRAAGVGWPPYAGRRLLPAAFLALVVVDAVLLVAWRVGKWRDPSALDRNRQRERIEFLVPHTAAERHFWPVLALAIGVMEECVYRGLFVRYTAALAPALSPWWLLVVAAFVFGVGHRYQGWLGMVATGALGLGFGVFTAATGSLWPAIVLHTVFDLRVAFLRPPTPATPSPDVTTAPLPPPPE